VANAKFDTVDQYLAAQPEETRAKLALVRSAIRGAVPQAREAISYQIPACRIGGRVFIFFAGWKNHYSLYPASDALLREFGSELAGYEISKGTIRFPLNDPVPEALISRLAKFKAEESLARAPGRPTRPPPAAKP
jgi:uncharacterized protein YdhG (YjbR/CyaY superfamily)